MLEVNKCGIVADRHVLTFVCVNRFIANIIRTRGRILKLNIEEQKDCFACPHVQDVRAKNKKSGCAFCKLIDRIVPPAQSGGVCAYRYWAGESLRAEAKLARMLQS